MRTIRCSTQPTQSRVSLVTTGHNRMMRADKFELPAVKVFSDLVAEQLAVMRKDSNQTPRFTKGQGCPILV